MKTLLVILFVVIPGAIACSDDKWDNEIDQVTLQKEKWQNAEPVSYQYRLERLVHLGPESTGPFFIRVQNSEIVSVVLYNQISGELQHLAPLDPYHIVNIFDEIAERLEGDPDGATLRYNDAYGYPTYVSIDPEESIADDEWGVEITDFTTSDTPIYTGIYDWEGALVRLNTQWDQWHENEPASYEYQLVRMCFCAKDYVGPFKVTVENGQIVTVLTEDWDTGEWISVAPTQDHLVDAVFESMANSLANAPDNAQVHYDATYGFPAYVRFDSDILTIDDEWRAEITDFRVLN